MPSLYRSSDVLIFPTLEDVWGLVVNEALWAGLPALVSVYAGCAVDLVPPESIFDPLDPGDFDRKLAQAVAEELPRPDPERLRMVDEVSATMASSLAASMRARGQ
jgi:glycosyltransferase involved in cell wall biosynthesis